MSDDVNSQVTPHYRLSIASSWILSPTALHHYSLSTTYVRTYKRSHTHASIYPWIPIIYVCTYMCIGQLNAGSYVATNVNGLHFAHTYVHTYIRIVLHIGESSPQMDNITEINH